MSHDRGCSCGKERWDYRECYARKGSQCSKAWMVRQWMEEEAKQQMNVNNDPHKGIDDSSPDVVMEACDNARDREDLRNVLTVVMRDYGLREAQRILTAVIEMRKDPSPSI